VVIAGEQQVEGAVLVQRMTEMGYRMVYSAAGPKVLHLLLSDGVLNRLYMTQANRLLGGLPFSSIVEGPLLEGTVDLQLNSVHLDTHALDGAGQLFLSYDPIISQRAAS